MKQVVSSIAYCHAKGIVHRDLKAENVMLKDIVDENSNEVQIKIIDFGISCKIEPNQTLTEAFGTPYYIAPEVIKQNYNEKCDIWSIGVIFYIILCGYPPFRGRTREVLNEKILKGEYSFDEKEWENISNDCKDLIRQMLTMDVDKRISAK